MAESTLIEWTDATQNFHIGCQKVGPGCDFCYAEAWNGRFDGGKNWGPGAPRRRTSTAIWNNPLKWQRQADAFEAEHGRRRRVFASSLSDIMDKAIPIEESLEAFGIMEICDRIDWQLLTKRVGNVEARVPKHWTEGRWPRNVGLMITVVNQAEADRDIPKLLELKAKFNIPWVGVSYEPALGPIDFTRIDDGSAHRDVPREEWGPVDDEDSPPALWWDVLTGERTIMHGGATGEWSRYDAALDWVIAGGESGPNARPAHPDWFRSVRDQCAAAGVAFLFKQWGEWLPHFQFCDAKVDDDPEQSRYPAIVWNTQRQDWDTMNGCWDDDESWVIARTSWESEQPMGRVGKKRAGRRLDGRIHNQFPDFTGSAPRAPQGQVAAGR